MMETQASSCPEVERLKNENDTLRKRIRMLEEELSRLRAKVVNVWGDS